MADPHDDLLKALKRANMTKQEKFIDDWSSILAGITILLLISTSFWVILHLIFLLPVTWLQVVGALVLLNLVKYMFR
jgi:predicted permease